MRGRPFRGLAVAKRGKIRVIFAIDIFNEGVDIPALDTVMFLRPTESYTIFLQQLGRGLRLHEGKKHLLVLDFIGNYKRAHYIPVLLSGKNPGSMGGWTSAVSGSIEYPPGCLVQFDFRLLDLFEEMAKRDPLKQRKRDDFYRLRDTLGRRPWRYDVYEGSDIPMRHYLRNGWLCFLQSVDSLTDERSRAEVRRGSGTKTSMTKSYKVLTIDRSSQLTAACP